MNIKTYIGHRVNDLTENQIEAILQLLDSGATIPFIARYRKERTSGADETQLEKVVQHQEKYNEITSRKATILKSIEDQDLLTSEIQAKIEQSFDLQELEDLYLPYKPKRQTRGEKAKKLGLEGLAKIIMSQRGGIDHQIHKFLNSEVPDEETAIQGAQDIIAEWINEHMAARKKVRSMMWHEGLIVSKLVKGKEEEAVKFKDYFDFSEPVKRVPSHRYLAIMRGEKEGFLRVKIEVDIDRVVDQIARYFIKNDIEGYVEEAMLDSLKRLMLPSTATQIHQQLKEQSDEKAIQIFSDNLKQLLMTPPVGDKRTLAIDPGFRTGCKIVCLDEKGDILHNETIYPHAPQKEVATAKNKIRNLSDTYDIEAIAIGDGTASRETEQFVKSIRFNRELQVFVVSEDGASIYSASSVARKEFPQYDVTVRGAISIGRRMMDPLSELVKIDPKSLGVGQYQHDVDQKALKAQLDRVVESVVNRVGVDVNAASPQLLQYVAGIGPGLADKIVTYRSKNGAFANRDALKEVSGLGAKAFEQSAGFLRINNGDQPLDKSAVHPERYALVKKAARANQLSVEDLIGNQEKIDKINWGDFASDEVGAYTLGDLKKELQKPGRDPRQKAKVLEFDASLKTIADVKPGMTVNGIITNVTNFGAFVNIGIKENALVHISELADRYISDPMEIVKLHQHLTIKIIGVDEARKRIQGSLKQA